MASIPSGINYIELYSTLRCNLNCSYCINKVGSFKKITNELSAQEFLSWINSTNFGDIPLTLGGGEPTIRKDFYELVNGIKPEVKIDLLTNLHFDIQEFIDKVDTNKFSHVGDGAYKAIRVSYHPTQMDPVDLVDKVSFLQDAGFSIGIFGISHPENIGYNVQMSEISRKKGVFFFIKEFLGIYNEHLFGFYKYLGSLSGEKEHAICRTSELLIGPTGDVFKCHRDLYANENIVGSIKDKDFIPLFAFRACPNFGECNYCDVKHKMNRFLEAGSCSVEIKT
jgi:sulfatase maturation enzyme AslB (radical SAM superfamily)